jgi:ABC-type multidrug transport system fused ATPase/permease subunit
MSSEQFEKEVENNNGVFEDDAKSKHSSKFEKTEKILINPENTYAIMELKGSCDNSIVDPPLDPFKGNFTPTMDDSLTSSHMDFAFNSSPLILSSINLSISRGCSTLLIGFFFVTFNLICILFGFIGPVGCGKSSLLNALLGEMICIDDDRFKEEYENFTEKVKDDIMCDKKELPNNQKENVKGFLKGKVGYLAQIPYIFNGTVKENILFGFSKLLYFLPDCLFL